MLGNLIYRLAEVPSRYAALRANRELVPNAIEESLRFDSPVQLLARTCTEKIDVDGVSVAKGDRVLYSIASANRDERFFSDPGEFRLDRPRPRDHVAFGAGPHVCPGAFLARMEAKVALETLLDRVERIELAPGYVFDPNPVFWALGPRTLRVRLIPAQATDDPDPRRRIRRSSDADGRFRVLDVHHHVGSAFLALGGPIDSATSKVRSSATPTPSPAEKELASRLEIMDGAGVDQAIVIPGHGYLRPRGIPDTRAENDLIARYRDRLPVAFSRRRRHRRARLRRRELRRARALQARARPRRHQLPHPLPGRLPR